jgi:hypothetical protein
MLQQARLTLAVVAVDLLQLTELQALAVPVLS